MTEGPTHILLATFNGARFLDLQLESIRAQSDPRWRLLVRDDGSDDETMALLRAAAQEDQRIRIWDDRRGRLGPSLNFFELMRLALADDARYFALCDQDDVWHPHKLAEMRTAMRERELLTGTTVPVLVCSDLEWIDADGVLLAASHFRRAGARKALAGAGWWVLAMNVIPGCAMLGNRALLEAALPPPSGLAYHDWWLLLVAASKGQVDMLDRALVRYRQHHENVVGASGVPERIMQGLASPTAALEKAQATYWQSVASAVQLLERSTPASLNPGWESAIRHTAFGLGSSSRWRRVRAVLGGPVRRLGWLRNLLMLLSAVRNCARPVEVRGSEPLRSAQTARMREEPPDAP